MGLETGDLISNLNELWPLGSDLRLNGDDHLRLIKHILRYTFSDTSTTFTITKGGYTFTFDNTGKILINGVPMTGGATIGDAPPSSPSVGQFWWESDTGNLFVYYDDGNTSQWVTATPGIGPAGPAGANGAAGSNGIGVTGGSITIATTAPASPTTNDVWIDTN